MIFPTYVSACCQVGGGVAALYLAAQKVKIPDPERGVLFAVLMAPMGG